MSPQLLATNMMLNSIILEYSLSKALNADIPDLDLLLAKNVSPALKHACLSWSHTLGNAEFSGRDLVVLAEFVYEKLLIWIEVMSLLGSYDAIGPSLQQTISYVKVGNP